MAEEITNPSEELISPIEETASPSDEMTGGGSVATETKPSASKVDMLWNALSKDDVYKNKVGSIDEFRTKMQNPEKAKMLWNALSKDEVYASKVGDEKTFLSKVSSPKPPAPSTKGGESGAVKTPSTSTSVLEDLESGSWTKTISPNKQEQPVSKPVIEVPKSVKQVEEVKPITSKDFQIKQGAIPDFTTERVDRSEKGFNKSLFDNYNSSFENYKSISDAASFHKKNIIQKSKSSKGVLDGFEEFISPQKAKIAEEYRRKELESQLSSDPLMQKLNSESKKAKSRFDYYTKSATEEIDRQLDAIANKNGGWDKFVKPLGEADVDKVRNAVDDFLVNNDINPDSYIAYKMRNEMKAKAEFKKIEPQVNTEFEINYKKKYGVTPDEDLQKEYGLKANEITGIKQAKDELEKRRALESQSLKAEFQPQINAYDEEYKTKLNALNSKVESDPELNNYANSLYKENFSKYQSLVNQGAMSAEQANQEMNSPQNLESINAKVIEKANEKYGKDFEAELTTYQKQLNELNSRYNSIYRRQESARLEQANKKIESELNKFKGSFKPSKEILERREKAYSDAYNIVGGKYSKAQENVTRELGHLRQTQALLSGLGGGLKSYGQYFDNKFLYDMGESIEANNLLKIPESKNFSDWLDADKLVVGTGNIVGRMIPMIGVSTATGFITRNWSATAQMATIGLTGWVTEGADMAGSIKGEVLEKTGDPVKADEAVKSMWQSHVYSMPLYAFSGLPFVNGLPTKIAKRIAPSLFKEVGKGTRRTFGQYLKQTAAAAAVSSIGETAEEIPQEFKQGIDEEAIRNGAEIKSISDQLRILKEGASWKRFGETVVQVAPSTFVMGSTPVFLSESTKYAKEKYYERSVDNYINGLSISEALETSPEQYIYNTLRDKGKNFTSTLINTLYTSGNIDEQTYDKLAGKLQDMDNFQNFLSKNKLEASSTTNIIGYKLHEQYQQAKKDLEDSTDELGKDILKDRVKKAKDEFDSFYKGEGVNAVVLTMGNGSQYVFSTEEMDSLLQFENIRNGIRNKTIGVTVYNRKGQKAFMETTLDEINIVFKEEPLEEELTTAEGEVVLTKNTSPTSDKYGTINRNDGKGVVDLTKEEFEAEQAKMQPKVDEQVAPTAEGEQVPKTKEEIVAEIERRKKENEINYQKTTERHKKELSDLNKREGKNYVDAFDILNVNEYSQDQSERSQDAIDLANKQEREMSDLLQEKRSIEDDSSKVKYSDYDLSSKQTVLDRLKKAISDIYFSNRHALDEGFEVAPNSLDEANKVGGSEYSAHGMGKTSIATAYSDLINLFTNGINPNRGRGKLDTAPLSGGISAGETSGNAYMDGAFTLVANRNHKGAITDISQIGGIIVNEGIATNEVLSALRELFPNLVIESTSNTKSLVEQLNEKYNTQITELEKQYEKEPTKKEDGKPMSGGVQGVRIEGEGGQESTELRTQEEEINNETQPIISELERSPKLQGGNWDVLTNETKANIRNAEDSPVIDGHGILRVPQGETQLGVLLKILQSGKLLGDWGKLAGGRGNVMGAWTSAPFIITGMPNTPLANTETRELNPFSVILNSWGEAYYESLKKRFPNVNFIKGSELTNDKLLSAQSIKPTSTTQKEEATPQAGSVVGASLRDVELKMRRPEKNEVIFVSVDALLQKHATDQPSYDVQKEENRIKGRVEKAKEFIKNYIKDQRAINPKTGERMNTKVSFEPSVVDIDANGKISFEDGRHRVLAAKEMGLTEVPIEVPKERAKAVEQSLQSTPTTEEEVSGGLTQEEKVNLENIAKEAGVNFQEVRNVYNKYGDGKPLNEITLEDYQKAEEKRQGGKEKEQELPLDQKGRKVGSPEYKAGKGHKIGRTITRTAPDGTKIKGTFKLVSAKDLLPSHNPVTFSKNENFPQTKDGKTINDRDYETDREAQAQVIDIAQNIDGTAVTQMPTVSKEGIVYDGNNRTMSRQLAAKNKTDQEYLDALKEQAEMYGFTENQVSEVENPMLVFEVEENLPFNTETMAKFNKQEKKAQSPVQRAVAISKRISDKAKRQLALLYEQAEVPSDVTSNPKMMKEAIDILVSEGLIQSLEIPRFMDKGVATPDGVSLLEGIVMAASLNEDAIVALSVQGMGDIKSVIIKNIVGLMQNSTKGSDSLIPDIAGAISIVQKAKAGKILVKDYLSQYDAFADNNYTLGEMCMALLLDTKKPTELKKFLATYNQDVGVENLFGEDTSKQGILDRTLLNIISDYEKIKKNLEGIASERKEPAARGVEEPQPSTKPTDEEVETPKQEEDAVQKQAAGQVPIQPKAGVGEEVEGGKPETKSEKATKESQKEIDELFDLYDTIDESKGLDKRKAADDFRNMQQSIKNPTLKRIFDNISDIHSQLEKQGLITKTKGCP